MAEVVGTAYVRIRALTARLGREIRDSVNQSFKDADLGKVANKVGDDFGRDFSKSTGDRIGREDLGKPVRDKLGGGLGDRTGREFGDSYHRRTKTDTDRSADDIGKSFLARFKAALAKDRNGPFDEIKRGFDSLVGGVAPIASKLRLAIAGAFAVPFVFNALLGAMQTLGLSLVSLLGIVGRVASGLVGLGAAGGAAVGALAVAMFPLIAAFKVLGKGMKEASKSLTPATFNELRSATLRLSSAQLNARESALRVTEAQDRLNKALSTTRKTLDDVRRAQLDYDGSQLDAEDAALRVIEAQEELNEVLADPTKTLTERRRAELSLREARQRASESTLQAADAQKTLNEVTKEAANKTRDVRQEELDLAQARLNHQQAILAISEAQENLTKTQTKGQAAAGALSATTVMMSEAAKRLSGSFDNLGKITADRMVPGLVDAADNLAILIGRFADFGGEVGKVAGDFARVATAALLTAEAAERFTKIQSGSLTIFRIFSRTVVRLGDILSRVFVAALPAAIRLTEAIDRFFARMQKSMNDTKLEQFFNKALDEGLQLFRILGDLTVGLKNFFRIGSDEAGGFFDRFERGAQRFRDFTESVEGQNKIRDLFRAANAVAKEFFGLLGDIVRIFIGPAFDPNSAVGIVAVLRRMRELLPVVVSFLGRFFGTLRGIVERLAGPLGVFARNVGELFRAFANAGGVEITLRILNEGFSLLISLMQNPVFAKIVGMFFGLFGVLTLLKGLGIASIFSGLLSGLTSASAAISGIASVLGIGLGPALLIVLAPLATLALVVGSMAISWDTWKEALQPAVDKLLPALRDLFTELKDVATTLAPHIKTFSDAFASIAAPTIAEAIRTLAEEVIPAFTEALEPLADEENQDGLRELANVLGLLAGMQFGGLVIALKALAVAIGLLGLNARVAIGIVTGFTHAMTGLDSAGAAVGRFFGRVGGFFSDLPGKIGGVLPAIGEGIGNIVGGFVEAVPKVVGASAQVAGGILGEFANAFGAIVERAVQIPFDILNAILNWPPVILDGLLKFQGAILLFIEEMVPKILKFFLDLPYQAFDALFGKGEGDKNGLTGKIKDGLVEFARINLGLVSKFADGFVSYITDIPEKIGSFATKFKEAGEKIVGGLFEGFTKIASLNINVARAIVNGMIDFLNTRVIGGIQEGIRKIHVPLLGHPFSKVTLPTLEPIPEAARGGIITQEGVFRGAEGNKAEAIIPLESGHGLRLLTKALREAGAGTSGITVTVERGAVQVVYSGPPEHAEVVGAQLTDAFLETLNRKLIATSAKVG